MMDEFESSLPALPKPPTPIYSMFIVQTVFQGATVYLHYAEPGIPPISVGPTLVIMDRHDRKVFYLLTPSLADASLLSDDYPSRITGLLAAMNMSWKLIPVQVQHSAEVIA